MLLSVALPTDTFQESAISAPLASIAVNVIEVQSTKQEQFSGLVQSFAMARLGPRNLIFGLSGVLRWRQVML